MNSFQVDKLIVNVLDNYSTLSEAAAEIVQKQLLKKPDSVICAATGASPLGLYAAIAQRARTDLALTAAIRIVKLDEWLGLPPRHESTCEQYLVTHLLDPAEGLLPGRRGRGRPRLQHRDD